MSLYFWLHIATISFPLSRSFEPKIAYASRWRALFPAIVLTAIFFILWDVAFTRNGVWGFNPQYLSGLFVAGLPIEEWIFFFTVPFASVFIYDCVIYFDKKNRLSGQLNWLTTTLGLALVVIAFSNFERDYTFFNFLFCGLLLLLHGIVLKSNYIGWFFVAYLIHLIPFLLVNGVLTGAVTDLPVVWYNNAENLGIRIGTIPVEDTVYALLLLLMNVTYYEIFKSRLRLKHN